MVLPLSFINLIQLLADGNAYNEQQIIAQLSLDSLSIQQHLALLSDYGLIYQGDAIQGYQLIQPLELLTRQKILQHLEPSVKDKIFALEIYPQIDSTNRYLLQHSQSLPLSHAHICIAESQTAGRGRQGRSWISPFAANIYLSIRWQFPYSAAQLTGLSLVIGMVVIQELHRLGIPELKLKWPNDIYAQQKKLAGILIELSTDRAEYCTAVIGLGLNVGMPKSYAQQIDQLWIDLRQLLPNKNYSRNDLIASLLNQLLPLLFTFKPNLLKNYLSEWSQYDLLANQKVNLVYGNQILSGYAKGINSQGLLLIELDNGITKAFAVGEVQLKKS